MNSPVGTRILELELGTDSSTTFAMIRVAERIEATLRSSIRSRHPSILKVRGGDKIAAIRF
jgi:hypothetical protein